jgi:adenylate kinase family enzyme
MASERAHLGVDGAGKTTFADQLAQAVRVADGR